jgi:hypothetical protein
MKQAATKQAGPGETVRSWMCTCGHVMFLADATIEQMRRVGGTVCGGCCGPLTLCTPLERDRPGQNFYRKLYDCPDGWTEIEWLTMNEESKALHMLRMARSKLQLMSEFLERRYAGGPNGTHIELALSGVRMEPCNA